MMLRWQIAYFFHAKTSVSNHYAVKLEERPRYQWSGNTTLSLRHKILIAKIQAYAPTQNMLCNKRGKYLRFDR
jgi:hypothetical protein